jgi:hypothetical protein
MIEIDRLVFPLIAGLVGVFVGAGLKVFTDLLTDLLKAVADASASLAFYANVYPSPGG